MKIRHLKTEDNIYSEHLTSQRPSVFDRLRHSISNRSDIFGGSQQYFPTNYSLIVKNPYLFVLIHLKKLAASKNILGISIPDICIFDGRIPYDVLYSEDGDIKGLRTQQSIRLKEVYSFFKKRSFEANTKKEELGMACFQNQEFLIMSDADLFITSRKHSADPFFRKLLYLRNKLNLTGVLIQVSYDESADYEFTAAATECFAGYASEEKMLLKYGEQDYLKYCNQKIALFLNYEQNIRVKKAIFCYSKSEDNQYFLTNVKQIDFHNLTQAIEQRQKRMKQKETERSQMLHMSHQKYERYKSEESKPLVKDIEFEMNSELFKITDKLSLKSTISQAIEDNKTEAAFKKLYPQNKPITELIKKINFMTLKNELLPKQQKRRIMRPSKFMNKCRRLESRVRATYTTLPIEHKLN